MSQDRPRPQITPITWVSAKQVLPNEAWDFTPWLADNLGVLASTLGFDELELERTEYQVGDYRLDILAAGDVDGHRFPVAIENQYGTTDHKHLGQLITYLASQERGWAIWVVEHASDAHRAAVEFLNRTTASDAEYGYALVQVRFTRAGADQYQVFLDVIERPNDFVREHRSGARGTSPERRQFLLELHRSISDALLDAGWADVEMVHGGSAIRLHYPVESELAGLGYVHVRTHRSFSYVHIYVSGYDDPDDNRAVIAALRERYGDIFEEELPEDAEVEWHAGRPQDQLDAIKIRFPEYGHDNDPQALAPHIIRTCNMWLELLAEDPSADLGSVAAASGS